VPALTETERGLVVAAATEAKASIEGKRRIFAGLKFELEELDVAVPEPLLESYRQSLLACPE
jgi:hypothetical protein